MKSFLIKILNKFTAKKLPLWQRMGFESKEDFDFMMKATEIVGRGGVRVKPEYEEEYIRRCYDKWRKLNNEN